VRNRLIVAALIVAAIFVVSGLRFVPGVRDSTTAISMPICGPLIDQYGHPAGDAGPCPSIPTPPEQLVWAPFWFR
jgi:hypothetical protein